MREERVYGENSIKIEITANRTTRKNMAVVIADLLLDIPQTSLMHTTCRKENHVRNIAAVQIGRMYGSLKNISDTGRATK
jgi:hypothetical protein